jgi:uncharacterized membrane protein (DUF106 family)
MQVINAITGALFDVLMAPFRPLGPWAGMLAVSWTTGLLMLAIFKKTSNQEGIRKAKNRIKAHLLEVRLYKDDLGQSLRSQGAILAANGRYFACALRPLLVMVIPLLLLLAQLNVWFGTAPLKKGSAAIIKVRLAPGQSALAAEASLIAPAGVAVETQPLRIEEEREIDWRIRAEATGRRLLRFVVGGREITKSLVVEGRPLSKVSARRVRGFGDELFNPGEKPLPKNTPVEYVEIVYRPARLKLLGLRIHWLVAFFVLSIAFGFSLKGVFQVEI